MLISPTYYFDKTFNISTEFLVDKKVKLVIMDIDNTLVTYGQSEPTIDVINWVESLIQKGINVILASNNHKNRVEHFNQSLQLPFIYHSMKPSRKCVTKAKEMFGFQNEEIMIIGDQIFTDIWCAHNSKVRSILVKPLPYKENLFFKIKRFLEKPFIDNFVKKHPDDCFFGKELQNDN